MILVSLVFIGLESKTLSKDSALHLQLKKSVTFAERRDDERLAVLTVEYLYVKDALLTIFCVLAATQIDWRKDPDCRGSTEHIGAQHQKTTNYRRSSSALSRRDYAGQRVEGV